MTNVKFLDKEYNEAMLKEMSVDDLVSLRNLVASNLGAAAIRDFKDHETAVTQTWKALVKYNEEGPGKNAAPKKKAAKPKKEPAERKLAKAAEPGFLKRPTRRSFSSVKILKQPEGNEGRLHRWPNYWDGMLIVDAVETEGCIPWDIMNWAKHGLMEITEPTDEEYTQRRAEWHKKHGLTDPDIEKAEAKAEREAAKAKREAAKAEAVEAAE